MCWHDVPAPANWQIHDLPALRVARHEAPSSTIAGCVMPGATFGTKES